MTFQILIVIVLTFIIHLQGTLSYSVRLVGISTKKIAVSFALFNIMVLISRASNSFQAPLLAKWIENNINSGLNPGTFEFRLILFSATTASIVGSLLIPSFQKIMSRAVMNFSIHKSIPKLLLRSVTKLRIKDIGSNMSLPKKKDFYIGRQPEFPYKIFLINIVVVSILTVGVLSSMYAGFIIPELRATAGSLSAVVNGIATILMFVVVDPYLSILTDEVLEEKYSPEHFKMIIKYMLLARVIGTILAQFLLIPFAKFISLIATYI